MENIHGGDIYQYEKILDFSANINPLGAPDSVKKALTEASNCAIIIKLNATHEKT